MRREDLLKSVRVRHFLIRNIVVFIFLVACTLVPRMVAQDGNDRMRAGLVEYLDACTADAGKLWSKSLCGRLIVIDLQRRIMVADAADSEGVLKANGKIFEGTMPDDFVPSNTSVRWHDADWATVLGPLPEERFARVRLLVHESFHRLQPELGLRGPDTLNNHLATEQGRTWLRLELRALSRALRVQGEDSRLAAKDAMLFRAYRNQIFPESKSKEDALELAEGMPEYTGSRLALTVTGETLERVARGVESFDDSSSYVRSLGYATGPALGFLLDRFSPEWRETLLKQKEKSVAGLLADAIHFGPPKDLRAAAEASGKRYGLTAIVFDEETREQRRQARLAQFKKWFIDGPVLSFPERNELKRNFNPNNLVPFEPYGTVYPTGTFTADWGRLDVSDNGALLAPTFRSLKVIAPDDLSRSGEIRGPGWVLKLNQGYVIQRSAKSGNYEVVATQ